MLRINNKNTRTRHQRRSGVFIVSFVHISHFFSRVSIADFEQVHVNWAVPDSVRPSCQISCKVTHGNFVAAVCIFCANDLNYFEDRLIDILHLCILKQLFRVMI